MSSSSLSNVVSTLVRASMGTSVPSTVTDEELDRHVAELILKEAKQKAQQYLEHGVKAYLLDSGPDERQPRANKRFLSAIIRNTDEHNKAILRAQAETAQEIRTKKEEHERGERRARAKEASEAERLRRLMGSSHRRNNSWDRWDGRRRQSSRERRSDDKERGSEKYRKRTRHRSRSRSVALSDEDSKRRVKRRHHREAERELSLSRDQVEEGLKGRTGDATMINELSEKQRCRARSRSTSPKRSCLRRGDDNPDIRKATRKKREKGKAVDRTPIEPHSLRSTTDHDIELTTADADYEPGQSTLLGLSRHQSRSPGKAVSRSPRPSSPQPSDLSSQFRARDVVQRIQTALPTSPTLSEEEDIERIRPQRRQNMRDRIHQESRHAGSAKLPSRSPSPKLSSKMDKYFESSYDPRLDTGPLTLPSIPSTGLIDGAEFEGWEAMLEVVRQRREDRAERKRLERLGLLPSDKEKPNKKTLGDSGAWTMDTGVSVMDIKYDKRGAVREWDMGK